MMASSMRCLPTIALTLLLCGGTRGMAAQLQKGDPAPKIEIGSWLNVPADHAPTAESLHGKVVMVEFWGTWCAPCVRAMPRVQQLHERYSARGLVVLAISYEKPEEMKGFLAKHSYTMPVGSDPEKKMVSAFGVSSWPATFLIDRDGKIAYAGAPYAVEPAIDAALGIKSSPSALLTAFFTALAGKDEAAPRSALERLIEKASSSFDLRAWAVAAEGGDVGGKRHPSHLDAGRCLDDYTKAVQSGRKRKARRELDKLAKDGPNEFDLVSWARSTLGRAYPIRVKEMAALLGRARYQEAVDALIERNPDRKTLVTAMRNEGFVTFAKNHAREAKTFARKGLMIQDWVLAGRTPKDEKEFWRDLSVSGMATDKDSKKVVGVIVAGEMLTKEVLPAWIDRQLARSLVLGAIAEGKPPRLDRMSADVRSDRGRIEHELESRYGSH